MAEIPRSADQKVINAIVNAIDPITLWRWKKAIDEREKLARNSRMLSSRGCNHPERVEGDETWRK